MPESPLLLLRSSDIARLIAFEDVVRTQEQGFIALVEDRAELGERVLLRGAANSVVFSYAARMGAGGPAVSKFGSVVPGNATRGLPSVSSIVVALDGETGRPVAIVDGDELTALRTVAASVAVVRALVDRPRRVAVIGSGIQGERHGVAALRHLGAQEVRVWSPDRSRALALGESLRRETGDAQIVVPTSPRLAVEGADVAFLCTNSFDPVVAGDWLSPGALVVSIGAFAPHRREVGREVLSRARLVVDHRDTAIRQCGHLADAIAAGVVAAEDVVEIGDIYTGRAPARAEHGTVTVYSSVGVGIQDAAVVDELLRRARGADVGSVEW
ncbi:ornithine cyclodeaminase family protein [Agromyces aerolatus]|uniref:ornithine cyclodeaminase family protein n=1 Tax=Agromyces sp. LY-1074 TaxID=3074080 RepID=UPI00285A2BE6|nr:MULTISPECIES: ornithine cyclodeaminase family protein [unclassified Agromyces]MDR5699331.1 ornithine cyclodeaminase family protein [Agromyces sp. LY-1074]MDR5705627.1 ornithine cyclodeaminase family protein [Agromyces sp. LY-1358]